MKRSFVGIRAASFAVLAAAFAASCQQIFTTSVAGFMAREGLSLPANLTSDQAITAAEQAIASGDASAAVAVLDRIPDLVAAATDPAQAAELKTTAVGLAMAASGIDQVITEVFELIGETPEPSVELIMAIVETIRTPASAIQAIKYLDDEGVSSSSDQKILSAVLLIVAETGGDLEAVPSLDPADEEVALASVLVQEGIAEITASGDSILLGLVSNFTGFLPQP